MRLPEIAVRRKTTFLMVFILMAGLGGYGFSLLGLDFFPEMSLNRIMVLTVLPGAGPEEIETLVSEPIEEAAALVGGVEHIESQSSASLSLVNAEFGWGTDLDQAEIDLRNALTRAKGDLPDDAEEPVVIPMDPSVSPVIVVSVGSTVLDDIELRRLVDDDINPMLTRIEGVASVVAYGGLERQINVTAEPALMERHGISISQIAGALSVVRNNIPAGDMDAGGMNFVLNVETAFHSLTEIESIVVGYHDGLPVQVGDVCTVTDGTEELVETIMVDGERSILIMVLKQSGANTAQVCNNVHEGLLEVNEQYGSVVNSGVVYDQSRIIRSSVTNLGKTGAQAVIIAVIVLLFFLGSWKTSGTVGLSIPLSVLLTFPVMAIFNVNLNMVSLAGLALSIGMLVDNSIVVLENIFRHRTALGASPEKASVEGASEVGMAVSASTMTTLAVFIPIMFVPGVTGRLFRDLSLTISSTLLVSLFVALTLIPLMTSRMHEIGARRKKGRTALAIDNFLNRVDSRYANRLARVLTRKKTVIGGAALLFLISLLVLKTIPSEFIPQLDNGMVQFVIYRSPGTELDSTDSTMVEVAAEIAETLPPEVVDHIYFTAGESQGVMAMAGGSGTNEANLMVRLVPAYDRDLSKQEIEEIIRNILAGYPDVEYSRNDPLTAALQGGDPVVVNVYGNDIETLSTIGEELAAELSAIDGVEDARSSLNDRISQYSFVPSCDVLSLRAASPYLLGMETNIALMGSDISVYRENSEEYDVNLRYPEEYRNSLADLNATVVNGMPLEAWGTFKEELIPKDIIRRDQNRVVTISGSISGTRTIGEIAPDVERVVSQFDMNGYRYEIEGQISDQAETFQGLFIALIVSAVLVYMVMASQFESLLEPFIIIFTVPLAVSGAIFMLALTGTSFSALSFIGLIMLVGIIVNNGIVMVDYANQLMDQGKNRIEAIVEAGRTRLRPILMTAATTVLAMVPVAIGAGEGGQLYAPMGRAVIGGLSVGTFLTLFVVPALYLVFGRFRKAQEVAE
ncbi:hypothetical protein CSA37_08260 [Candidatus Fermentibacteria bacterium]|nr:MAG: hypothetical protein CSA37_08260 [Candidatus Fermentibacteria bacterium]